MPDKQKGLSRSLRIARDKIDAEKRTVELAFSSESPVERWGENEVLSHDKGDYDFSRVASGTHPLLLGHAEHDPNSQIGVIESARVDADKVGRAVVRFGNSDKANEIFKDVQDGIRQLVSVGYDITGGSQRTLPLFPFLLIPRSGLAVQKSAFAGIVTALALARSVTGTAKMITRIMDAAANAGAPDVARTAAEMAT